jgi:membrane protease YdiL (CAAX protease family)
VLLFALITFACALSYGILMIMGDVLPLHKLISKLTQVLLVLSIFPLRRYLNLSWSELGFAPKAVFFPQIGKGLGFGILSLLPIILILYGLGVQVFDDSRIWTIGVFAKKLTISLLLAVLISVVEESLFRGLLLGSLRQKTHLIMAIFLSAIYYAALHFLESHTLVPYQNLTFSSGFMLVGEAIGNWFNPLVLSGFMGLLAVGIFLATIRSQLQQSLGLCIGLHASWVWQIKMTKDILNVNYDSPYSYLVSNYDGIVGPLVTIWMLSATLAFWVYRKKIIELT